VGLAAGLGLRLRLWLRLLLELGPENACPGLDPGWGRFSEKIMLQRPQRFANVAVGTLARQYDEERHCRFIFGA